MQVGQNLPKIGIPFSAGRLKACSQLELPKLLPWDTSNLAALVRPPRIVLSFRLLEFITDNDKGMGGRCQRGISLHLRLLRFHNFMVLFIHLFAATPPPPCAAI